MLVEKVVCVLAVEVVGGMVVVLVTILVLVGVPLTPLVFLIAIPLELMQVMVA